MHPFVLHIYSNLKCKKPGTHFISPNMFHKLNNQEQGIPLPENHTSQELRQTTGGRATFPLTLALSLQGRGKYEYPSPPRFAKGIKTVTMNILGARGQMEWFLSRNGYWILDTRFKCREP
jgi:hypothetical protein